MCQFTSLLTEHFDLVGDHSLSSPDLNVCFMGDNVRRNWMLVTLIGERDNHIDFSFDFMV